jgi:hypothetical protein
MEWAFLSKKYKGKCFNSDYLIKLDFIRRPFPDRKYLLPPQPVVLDNN